MDSASPVNAMRHHNPSSGVCKGQMGPAALSCSCAIMAAVNRSGMGNLQRGAGTIPVDTTGRRLRFRFDRIGNILRACRNRHRPVV